MSVDVDPLTLSLDDIIRMRNLSQRPTGSVKSFGSNKSYRSNYSNKSFDRRSNVSHHSFRNMGNNRQWQQRRGRNDVENNAVVHCQYYKGPNNFNRNANQTRLTVNREISRLRNVTNSYARSSVKRALNLFLRSSAQNRQRLHPYLERVRQPNRLQLKHNSRMFDEDDSRRITINFENENGDKVPRRPLLLSTGRPGISPMRRFTRTVSNSPNITTMQNNCGPKLDPEVQAEIEDHMKRSITICEPIPQEVLNTFKVTPYSTNQLITVRFASYL